jgi:transposase
MMGRREGEQGQFFYSFHLDKVVPPDHLVRQIDGLLDLDWVHTELAPYYSHTGRPSIDPVLMIRMLLVGYIFAIRSERRICAEIQVNLAYRWFCKLGIEDRIPDHSVFCRARNERFRESDALRRVPGLDPFFAYDANYLIDNKAGIIIDAAGSRANRAVEIAVTQTMVEKSGHRTWLRQQREVSSGRQPVADG